MSPLIDRLCSSLAITAHVLVAICILGLTQLRAEEPNAPSPEKKPASHAAGIQPERGLIGFWTRRAVPPGGSPKSMGTQVKFFSDKYWIAAHHDDSGFALYALGGTYDLVDDKYTENVAFGTLYCESMIGQAYTFKISVDENDYWQIGLNNDYTEKYARVRDGEVSQLAQRLIGAWTRTTVPFADSPKAKCIQYKFFAGKHWIQVDTNKAGLALTAHGGTYELSGDECTQKTTYSTDFNVHQVGEESNTRFVVKDDEILPTGLDDPLAEKWTRIK